MDSTTATSPSLIKTYSIAALLFIASFAVLFAYTSAALETSLLNAPQDISQSGWAVVIFFDASFGAVFAVYYLFVRNGPSVACIPAKLFAFLWPFISNFALLWYVAYMILLHKDLRSALIPYSTAEANGQVPMRTQRNRRTAQIVASIASFLFFVIVVLDINAMRYESFSTAWTKLLSNQNKWITFTYADSLAGLLFTAIYIIEREGGPSPTSVLWAVALLVLGNAVTCVYVFLMALQAISEDVPITHVLLSSRKTIAMAQLMDEQTPL
ncbi:hypothetical protein BWQ96_00671 [Gracilariopsis chorda]|uniref:Uncharacterized protein n=1 Tax=Gracilariopsis chorda TaxID=448386 RepID=A0A2V3J599_9FLOR|nr:hypothetical protein BWQ96_00671 [Gracilariopsis chorda]|eukprot:PXF49601.1 hypothetical protein BWQ96_00671 [Gracilariopsis chorda]